MNKEIIKLNNRAGKITLWVFFGICLAIGITLIIVDRFFIPHDGAFDVGAVFRWLAIVGFIFGAFMALYLVLFCGKLVVDFDREEFLVYKLFSTKKILFHSVITIQRGVTGRKYYCIEFWLDSGKIITSGLPDSDGQANEALARKLKKIVDNSRRKSL